MEIWGVQIPIDYVVVGGAALAATLVVLASRRLASYFRQRAKARTLLSLRHELEDEGFAELDLGDGRPYNRALVLVHGTTPEERQNSINDDPRLKDAMDRLVTRYIRLKTARIFLAVNIITSALALVPLFGAIAALVSAHADLALQLDIVGLVTLVVTKGGLWLLTMALIPLLKGLPVGVGSGIGNYFIRRMLKDRDKDRKPAEKK